MKKLTILGITCFAMTLTTLAMADARVGDPYSLNTCPISGEKLGSMGESPVLIHEGREVRFCCAGCEKKYLAKADEINAEIDKKLIADQEAHYPATTCINSGAALKDGGVSFVVGNRLVKTCCAKCEAKVKADPAAYIAKLDAMVVEAQKDGYKSEICPISGKPLGETPVEIVVANRLVKVCCEGCKKKVDADPAGTIEKISAAN